MNRWSIWLLAVALLGSPALNAQADHEHGKPESGEGGESGETELKARLAPAKGSAEYHTSTKGRSLEASVKTRLAAGNILTVNVNGGVVGTYTVGKNGQVNFKLSTRKRQTVPAITKGSTIQVLQGTALISGGKF